MKRLVTLAFLLMITSGAVFSQSDSGSHYDQQEAFAPFFYPSNGNEYRSAGGAPAANLVRLIGKIVQIIKLMFPLIPLQKQ